MSKLIAYADNIAVMSNDDRDHALAALPHELAGWDRFFHLLFQVASDHVKESDEPDAAVLLAEAQRNGFTRDEAKQLLADLITHDAVLDHWTNWTQTLDRDELRLRLEILACSAHWHEELSPFITFFFRASVADLYQHAAVAMGRHLHHSERLREYLMGFSAQRSLPLDEPIALNGSRSSRRVMIALAAARSNPPTQLQLSREPVPLEQGENGRERIALPQQPADLATVLLALDVMITGEPDDEEVIRRIRDVLWRISHMPAGSLSRAVVQRFGGLLTHCGGEETEENWSRLFDSQQRELRSFADNSFGRRVAALFRLDELMHCAAVFPDAYAGRIAERIAQMSNRAERRFVAARILIWAQRERQSQARWTQTLFDAVKDIDGAAARSFARLTPNVMLDRLEQCLRTKARPPEPLFADVTVSADVALFEEMLGEIEQPAVWMSHEEPQRALLAMVMIDLAQHMRAPRDQMNAVLQRRGFAASASGGATSSTADSAVTSILLRLLTWEKPGAEDLIDVRMLHRIDDVRVLLALIPTGRRSPLLPILADAMEHQLRWRLRRDERFSPDVFLALTQVRQPHPQLYQSLQALCEGRTYRRVDGDEIDILPLVRHVREEAEREPDSALAAAPSSDSPYAASVSRLRQRLQAAQEPNDDVRTRIELLLGAIGEAAPMSGAQQGTVISILQLLHDAEMPLLQDGYPVWTDVSLGAYLRDLEIDLVRIKALVHALMPETWRDSDEVREAASSLRSLLDRRLNELARSLPAAEADALRELHTQFDAELAAWSSTIESVMDGWPETSLRSGAGGVNFNTAKEALAAIGRIEHALLRSQLLGLLWQSLREWTTTAGAAAADAWSMQKQLLDEALSHPLARRAVHDPHSPDATDLPAHWTDTERDRAQSAFLAVWSDLAAQAMERNEERRVMELATDPSYEPLRRQSNAAEVLSEIRKWCHDRYLLRAAASVKNDLRAGQQPAGNASRKRSVIREVWPFLGNFPTIWLAMLIGAIFMLDFGDAWAAMAEPEVGDIRGITITFLIGIGGAFGYVYWNLRQKSRPSPGEQPATLRRSQLIRAGAFSTVCLVYTLLLVSGLWWLLSETDEVVEGVWAIGHIIVWSGFALFVGVFFGLLAGDA